ncbi:MAG: NAD(P)H-dependent oxidoreductase [Cryobacterium sp.]|nr:NAD(P)H-dependent oxidoreductase [Cryobacterium sp.]
MNRFWRAHVVADADAIIFRTPTYVGSASGAFHAFVEAPSKPWMQRTWQDKFADSPSPAPRAATRCTRCSTSPLLAEQHGIHWVSLGLLPGWNTTTSTDHDDNRLGSHLGAGAKSWTTDSTPSMTPIGAPHVTSAAASQIPPTRSLPADPFPETPPARRHWGEPRARASRQLSWAFCPRKEPQ